MFGLSLLLLIIASCATASPSSGGFIVNGEDADISEFPHQLALFDRGRYFCGASIISRLFALSAAHCLDMNTPPELLNLRGGSTSRLAGHLIFVERYALHPNYRTIRLLNNKPIWDYDVAILEAYSGTPLDEFPHMLPTTLPASCEAECCGVCAGDRIQVAGWGRLANGTIPTYLQQLTQTITTHSDCGQYWEGHITDRMFCVTSHIYDTCDGDSGSAILDFNDRRHQVGYVSFGSDNCGDGSAPAVYGRLENPSIREFIRQQTGI